MLANGRANDCDAFGATASMLLLSFFNTEQIESWGWRIPFLIGLIIVPVGFYIRWYLHQPIQKSNHSLTKESYFQLIKNHWQEFTHCNLPW